MTDETEAEGAGLFPKSVGERLAAARIAAKSELADISTRTKIPLRHLEAIEQGRYGDLPSATYASGFSKAYGRALGMDETAIGRDVRAELQAQGAAPSQPDYFEPADPKRVPPRMLVWTTVVVAMLIVGGYALFRSGSLDGLNGRDPNAIAAGTQSLDEASPVDTGPAPAVNTATPAAPAGNQVVLTATAEVWVRIYDATDQRLFENTMQPGDRFEVPATANNPQINIGRPEALRVTVGGQEVPPLGPPARAIRDVGISAAALAARAPISGTPPAPGAGATPDPQASMVGTAIPLLNGRP